ncbi:cold-shock protein [Streptomyces sp. NPDC060194]|uniref:cold-shock protein n=1 Tax=Streptomyces sp. NPDC060194 TaxID=3347069 RepID=UPI003655C607
MTRRSAAKRTADARRAASRPVHSGRVREWHGEEGWGVLTTDALPEGVWAHYSVLVVDGFRELAPGQAVTFTVEAVHQDGYPHRALQVWPTA